MGTPPIQHAARADNPSEVAVLHGYVCSANHLGVSSTAPFEYTDTGDCDPGRKPKPRSSLGLSLELAFYSLGLSVSLSFLRGGGGRNGVPEKRDSRVTGTSSTSSPCPTPRPLLSHLTPPWSVPENHTRTTSAIWNNKDN